MNNILSIKKVNRQSRFMVRSKSKDKKVKNLLLHQSSVIGWVVIVVEPAGASIQTIMLERIMIRAKSTRIAFLIGRTMDVFVKIIPVRRTT